MLISKEKNFQVGSLIACFLSFVGTLEAEIGEKGNILPFGD
ncbi:hypothetical protein [Muribacter muris]|nr:hypothetical protein [Muribacter muris]